MLAVSVRIAALIATALTQYVSTNQPPVCFYKGQYYWRDTTFKPSPCEHCSCSSNLEVYCQEEHCPYLNCVNSVFRNGTCCPVCPTGPNCLIRGVIVPVGQTYKPSEYETCMCDQRLQRGLQIPGPVICHTKLPTPPPYKPTTIITPPPYLPPTKPTTVIWPPPSLPPTKPTTIIWPSPPAYTPPALG